MFKKTLFTIFLAVTLTYISLSRSWPSNFDALSADAKLAWFAAQIKADNNKSGSWYGTFDLSALLNPAMLGGLDFYPISRTHSDKFPTNRKKLIHTVAGAATWELRPVNNSPYSGCFAYTGKNCAGVIRFSSAAEPTKDSNAPGISFKLFRSGIESADFMAMWKSEGQSEGNFFKNIMSNHVNAPDFWHTPMPIKAVYKKSESYEADPTKVGTYHVAKYTRDGKVVSNFKPPYQLVIKPNPSVYNLCQSHLGFESTGVYKCLSKIASGTVLYRMYGVSSPKKVYSESDLNLIGDVVLTSTISGSKFMDEEVEFRHVLWTEETQNVTNPDWKSVPNQSGFKETCGAPKFENIMKAAKFAW